jgi:hypothetical protein
MPRLDFSDHHGVARSLEYVASAGSSLADTTVPVATQNLVKIRAIQINGCGGERTGPVLAFSTARIATAGPGSETARGRQERVSPATLG